MKEFLKNLLRLYIHLVLVTFFHLIVFISIESHINFFKDFVVF